MITLKELVNRQILTGEDDSSLIAEWFEQNDMAIDGIDIVSKIAKKKITNDKFMYGTLVSDLSMYGATENIIKDFGAKNGCKLNSIITRWIVCFRIGEKFEEKYPTSFDWLKEFIPQQKQPFIFWQPFLKWMNEQDIYFIDQKRRTDND